ncbi:MAG: hypothetical protein AB1597_05745 [Chloroflexota bacterium]
MSRYAQWIDSAYIQLAEYRLAPAQKQLLLDFLIWRLKLHALFGDEFVLSDIQAVDSQVIQKLFLDEDKSFHSFLARHPSFLSLVARPLDPMTSSRWAIVSRGLERTQHPYWISSSMPNPEPIKLLAQQILEANEFDSSKWLFDKNSPLFDVVQKWPEREQALKGIVGSIGYFNSSEALCGTPQTERSRTLWEVLCDINLDRLPEEEQKRLLTTRDFIEKEIPEKFRGMQSAIFSALPKKITRIRTDYQVILQTTHFAWNTAVMETVSPNLGSLGYLKWGVNAGKYLNHITDVVLSPRDKEERLWIPKRRGRPLFMGWDPGRLSWLQIADIRLKTSTTARQVQEALWRDDPCLTGEALQAHVQALGAALVEKPPPLVNPLVWVLGGVTLLIAKPELLYLVGMGKVSEEGWREVVYRIRKFRWGNTLKEFGREITRTH